MVSDLRATGCMIVDMEKSDQQGGYLEESNSIVSIERIVTPLFAYRKLCRDGYLSTTFTFLRFMNLEDIDICTMCIGS